MTTLLSGAGNDKLIAGRGTSLINGDGGRNRILKVKPTDVVVPQPGNVVTFSPVPPAPAGPPAQLSPAQVDTLLRPAPAASPSEDAIIVVMDRGGRLLGVRTEAGVSPAILNNPASLTFAIDGAMAEARTGAFFGNNQAPLTSRTIQFISQTTMTQRE